MTASTTTPLPSPANCTIATTIERFGRMLTVKEFAHLTSESPKTVYSRVKRGAQPATILGTAVKFDPYLTAAWLRARSA
jgi:predicted DNA-binding transcriptional regulator AlpA